MQAQNSHENKTDSNESNEDNYKKYAINSQSKTNPITDSSGTDVLWTAENDRIRGGVSPSFWQSFGGPDAFMLYQLGVRASGEFRITPRTWISGSANLRLIDNYDKFQYLSLIHI